MVVIDWNVAQWMIIPQLGLHYGKATEISENVTNKTLDQ